MEEIVKAITRSFSVEGMLRLVNKTIDLAALPTGTRRQRKGGIYEKQPDGSWTKVSEKKDKKEDEKTDNPEKAVENARDYNSRISEDVKSSAISYTEEASGSVNSMLRNREKFIAENKEEGIFGVDIDQLDKMVEGMDTYLEDAPKFTGTVHRGMSFPSKEEAERFMGKVKSGAVFEPKSYFSTTSDKDVAESFDFGAEVVMNIKAKNAVSFEGLSVYPDEKEYLFPRKTKFRVLKVATRDGISVVDIEEI